MSFGALIGAAGCTALSDFKIEVCATNADCDELTGPIQRCEEQRCVPGCADNRHCSNVDPRLPICPTFGAQCVGLSAADGVCPVSSGYADETMGPLTGKQMLLIGAFIPELESSDWLTVELAADEINRQGGLPTNQGAREPVVVVACDNRLSSIEPAMTHLVNELGTLGILASLDQDSLQAAVSLPATRGSSMLLTPDADPAQLSPMDPLVRSLGVPILDATAGYPQLLDLALQAASASGSALSSMRIASLVSSAAEDIALEGAVRPLLRLGDKDVEQLRREDRFHRVPIPDDSSEARARTLEEIGAYAPDIVLVFLGGSFDVPRGLVRSTVVSSLELSVAASGTWRPLFVLGPRNLEDPRLVDLARSDPSFRARSAGVTVEPERDVPLLAALTARFQSAYPAAPSALAPLSKKYDAMYYLAYALAAAPRGISGAVNDATAVLAGLDDVSTPGSPRVPVGPGAEGLEQATELLASGSPFETFGASGPPLISAPEERASTPRFYCLAPAEPSAGPPDGGAPPELQSTFAALACPDEEAHAASD